MTKNFIKIPSKLLLSILVAVLVLISFDTWLPNVGWFDQQRIVHVMYIAIASCMFFFKFKKNIPPFWLTLSVFFILGLLSAFLSRYTFFALKEWSLFFGFFLMIILFSQLVKNEKERLFVTYGIAITAFINSYIFFTNYFVSFITGIKIIDANVLFTGFSNPRFLNQFQGVALPIISYLLTINKKLKYNKATTVFLLTTLILQWCIAFTLGGRALWLGIGVSHLFLIFIAKNYCRLIIYQAISLVCGFLLFWLMFYFIPEMLEIPVKITSSLRTNSSGRIELWIDAWHTFVNNPWLGVGPMHLASNWALNFPSPHQALLQFLSEWGLLATIFLVWASLKISIISFRHLKHNSVDHYYAAIWVVCITYIVIIQFDGASAPFTHLWLAALIGAALFSDNNFIFTSAKTKIIIIQTFIWKLFSGIAFLTFVIVLFYEVPMLGDNIKAHTEKYQPGLKPRFWSQGWIPMNP